jgi:hypothetical protein
MSGIFKLFLPDDGYSRNMSGIFKLFLPDDGYSRNMSGICKKNLKIPLMFLE